MLYFKVLEIDDTQNAQGGQWHSHAEGQIYLIQENLTVIEIDNARTIIPPGRIGWVPPGVKHRTPIDLSLTSPNPILGFSIYLHPSLCTELPANPLVIPQTELLKALIQQLFSLQSLPWGDRLEHLIQVLVDEFNAQKQDPLLLPMPQDKRLFKMAEGILREPHKNVSLEEWSRKIAYSSRSISRKFLEETGMSVAQWRQIVRLEKSLLMLGQGASVTDAAIEVGYDSVSSFIKMFKKILGMTPAQLYTKSESRKIMPIAQHQ